MTCDTRRSPTVRATHRRARALAIVLVATGVLAAPAMAQDHADHGHTMRVNGVGGGLPLFCANPTAAAVRDGAWSDTSTWSSGRVPGPGDRVAIGAGRTVTYDVQSEAALACVEVRGRLAFARDGNTRLRVVNLTVLEDGTLEIGTESEPVAADVTAEISFPDQPFDPAVDPGQVGNGLTALGTVTMHGAAKRPTFVRLQAPARAGQTTLTLSEAAVGWRRGDRIVVPDTRQLRAGERIAGFHPQDERAVVSEVTGTRVTLTAPLRYDHNGSGGAADRAAFLPHIGNLSRNVVLRSENPAGTRGHMIFLARADVDMRYVEVDDMGRTRVGTMDSTAFDGTGKVKWIGTNQIGRYAIHFHHTFGPKQPRHGRQYTLIGNVVSEPAKWGVTIHNTHYGLVQDNIVYGAHGAAFVTEDGSESFNVFDHNFAVRVHGSGDAAPRGGYGGAVADPGGDGSGFWFQGPNNYIRNNVAATSESSGFNLAARLLGTLPTPAFQGADVTVAAQTKPLDSLTAPVLEFAGNEAYGATPIGIDCGWDGNLVKFTAWNIARYAVMGTPTSRMVIDGLVVRGDPSLLDDAQEDPTGIWIGNYASKDVAIRRADIEG
ncbi:MAG: G8 domain-containing protein, partial [Vicinamibacterales bacterium]